jgi:hypothetical protein
MKKKIKEHYRFKEINIIDNLDNQIKRGLQIGIISKELYLNTLNFTMNDWRLMRDQNYWDKVNYISNLYDKDEYYYIGYLKKMKYLLKTIKIYKNGKN